MISELIYINDSPAEFRIERILMGDKYFFLINAKGRLWSTKFRYRIEDEFFFNIYFADIPFECSNITPRDLLTPARSIIRKSFPERFI